MMALRSTPCQSTGFSPYYLLFGKEMHLPFDTALLPKPSLGKTAEHHLKILLENLKVAKSIAKDNMVVSQEINKERLDVKAKDPSFVVGDQVLMQDPTVKKGLSPKLSHKWAGPYTVTSLGPNHTFKLRNTATHKVHASLIHANRLKTYTVRDINNPRLITRPPPGPLGDPPPRATIVNKAPATHIPSTQSSDTGNDATPHSQSRRVSHSHPVIAPPSTSKPIAPSAQACSRPLPGNLPQLYTVDRILGCKLQQGVRYYHIKWVGYSRTTWEPASNLNRDLIRQFHLSKTLSGKARKHGFKYFK
jgi:hypothetical protein